MIVVSKVQFLGEENILVFFMVMTHVTAFLIQKTSIQSIERGERLVCEHMYEL